MSNKSKGILPISTKDKKMILANKCLVSEILESLPVPSKESSYNPSILFRNSLYG